MNNDEKNVFGRPVEQAFSVKALSVGIGLGDIRPAKGSKFKSKAEPCPVVTTPATKSMNMASPVSPTMGASAPGPAPFMPKPLTPNAQPHPPVSVGNLNNLRRGQTRPALSSGRKWWLGLFAHLVDLSIVVVSAGMVILMFGILSRQRGDGISDMFRDSLSFWVGKFSYLEILLLIYAGLLIYWMIFRLVAGHTIGQSLRLESMNWSKVRGMMRNGQQS